MKCQYILVESLECISELTRQAFIVTSSVAFDFLRSYDEMRFSPNAKNRYFQMHMVLLQANISSKHPDVDKLLSHPVTKGLHFPATLYIEIYDFVFPKLRYSKPADNHWHCWTRRQLRSDHKYVYWTMEH